MIYCHWDNSKFEKFLVWFIKTIFPQQIAICPDRLYTATKMFEDIIKTIEATQNKIYRSMCIHVLTIACNHFDVVRETSSTPIEKAYIEATGLMSFSEKHNSSISLFNLKAQLMQLNRLHNIYNLDLNLGLLKGESKISLASRLLDQIPTNDLCNNKDLPKLKDFLKEFNLGTCEFFYSYIKKLIDKVSLRTDDDLENRFITLLNNISERQLSLECLIEFASKTEVPFKEKLSQLIEKEIRNNSINNSSVKRLQLLQRKSNLTPLLNKYGIQYNSEKTLYPESLIRRMLRKESSFSSSIIHEDIKHIVHEYKIDDLVLINVKCSVYIYNIMFEDDMVSSTSFTKLKIIINFETYPHTMKNVIVERSFETFINFFNMQLTMCYTKLQFVLDVARWIVSKIYNKDQALHWKETFDTLIFCLSQRYDSLNGFILLSEFICQNDITSLSFTHCRYDIIRKCVDLKLNKVISNILKIDNYCLEDVSKEVSQGIGEIEFFCFQSIVDTEPLLIKIFKESFHEILVVTAKMDEYLAFCILYSYLNIMMKWGMNSKYKYQSCFDESILEFLNDMDLSKNIYLLWNIFKVLVNLIALHIFQKTGYLYKGFIVSFRIANFILNITRIFAELESPGNFETLNIHNMYREVPLSFDSFHKIIPLIQSGVNVLSSKNKNTFQSSVNNFAEQSSKFVVYFWKEGVVLLGCTSLVDVLSILLNNNNNMTTFSTHFEVNSKKMYFFHILDDIIKMKEIDNLFAVNLLLLFSREAIINKVKSIMHKCKSSRKMLEICAITVEVLTINKDIFSMDEIKELFAHILSEAKKHYWANILKQYQISMFKKADKSRIKLKCFEMLHNPNIPVYLVEDFVLDFDLYPYHVQLELFKDLFKTDFNECSTFYSYKIKVETLLQRAEEIWISVPNHDKEYHIVCGCFNQLIEWTSPYHYEILQYVYERLHSISFCNEYEPVIIKLLYKWTRISPIGEVERQYCQERYVQEELPNPLNASYLTSTRLPFNLIIGLETMSVLEQELHSTNANLWVNLYTLLNKIGGHSKADMNPDLLQLQAVENLFSDFIKFNKVNDSSNDITPLFLGKLYSTSSMWFEETVKLGMSFLEQLLVNSSFVEIIKKTFKQLSVGEQRIYLIDIALRWIDDRLTFIPCTSRDVLIKWKNENIALRQRLEVEKILFESNFYLDEFLEIIPDFTLLLESILNSESLVTIMKETVRDDVIKVIKKISHIASIDLNDFVFNMVLDTLKLQTSDHILNMSSDHDVSILNISVDSTASDYKAALDINFDLNTKRMELLSSDSEIQNSIMRNLSHFLITTFLNLEHWLHVFVYLFRSYCHGDDLQGVVASLNNIHTYRLFLLVVELHSLGVEFTLFGECNLTELLEYLEKFRLEEKTELVKRLYFGDAHRRSHSKLRDSVVDKKSFSVLKHLIDLCPESIDTDDEIIKDILGSEL